MSVLPIEWESTTPFSPPLPEEHHTLLQDEPLKDKLLRNWFRLYFFWFIGAPAGYVIKVLIAGELSVGDIGVFYSIIGFIGIISAYNDLGLTEALQYYLPHYFIDKEFGKAKTIIVFTWVVQFLSIIVVCGVLRFWADWLTLHYFKSDIAPLLLRYFCLYFLFINLYQVLQSVFIATQKVKIYSALDAARIRIIVLLTAGSIRFSHLTVITFTIWWITGLFLATMGTCLYFRKEFKRLFSKIPFERSKHVIQKQRSYGFRVLLGTSAGTLLGQVNQQLALYRFGPEAAGQWAYYLSFLTLISVIVGPIISYLFPLLNELYKKDENIKIRYLYKILFLGTLIFGVVGGVSAYFFAEPFAVFLYGEQFRQAGTLFRSFAPFIFTIPLSGILFQDIASRGLVKQRVFAIFMGLCINILISWRLWHSLRMQWIVYGQVAGTVSLIIMGMFLWKKNTHNTTTSI